jgi:hypothetical protein
MPTFGTNREDQLNQRKALFDQYNQKLLKSLEKKA